MGEDLFSSLDKEHDILDRDLRPFVEEADQMQAIQLMTSLDDAWGGFAARYMDRLRDEYGKTAIWIWGLQDGIGGTPRVSDFPVHGPVVDPIVPHQRHDQPSDSTCMMHTDVSSGQAISQALQYGTINIRDFTTGIAVYSRSPTIKSFTALRQY